MSGNGKVWLGMTKPDLIVSRIAIGAFFSQISPVTDSFDGLIIFQGNLPEILCHAL